jgi:peroxiredoxin
MKIFGKSLLTLAALGLSLSFSSDKDKPMLSLGADAPMINVPMADIGGESFSLAELKKEKGLLVIFSCNTCPFVVGWEDQYAPLKELADTENIGMVLVNSNERKRDGDDSMEEMQKHAKELGYSMKYVVDVDNKLADAFGARTTPHVYLFDGDMKLAYRGSINDKYENRSKQAENLFLENAMKALSLGAEIRPSDTREMGCSIKRS